MTDHAALLGALRDAVGADQVRTDDAARRLFAADLYAAGAMPVTIVRPADAQAVAKAVAATTSHGYAVVPRGGGLSYTGGYACETGRAVVFDLSALDRIVEISDEDMIVVAEAGVTWKQLYEALVPRGLRLPFFGTFSGAGATIGGGLSHGALFFGSARHHSAAENVLALEVATADGTLLGTGQWALARRARPTFRGFGPDTTGLFLHDGGALGIKTRAAFRLIRTPAHYGYGSFVFTSLADAARAMAAVARAGVAEDCYVLDPMSVGAAVSSAGGVRSSLAAAGAILRTARGAAEWARALATLGHSLGSAGLASGFSLHCVTAGASRAAAAADLATARRLAREHGGRAVAAVVPRMARADPFPNLDGILGSDGARWAALNAKLPHSQGVALAEAHRRLVAGHAAEMAARGVRVTYLMSALGTHGFSFEAVFYWHDRWLPLHRQAVAPDTLARRVEPPANPAARTLVENLRGKTVALFREFRAASNQIGRTYPYLDALAAEPAALVRQVKAVLDPQGLMNPGVLGLR